MEIITYSSEYDELIKDLLVELQEYIVSIDKDKYSILTKEYREKYFEKVMGEVTQYEGKIFLAKEENNIIGLIIGVINNESENTYDATTPKCGRITELVVSKSYRFKGIGNLLLNKMEEYFKSVGCESVLINVLAYNDDAKELYYKNNYFDRNIEMIKKI